jgi:hypothetical protein
LKNLLRIQIAALGGARNPVFHATAIVFAYDKAPVDLVKCLQNP